MSSFFEATGKKLFTKHLEKYTPEDPLYEFYTNKNGKQKRRKRQLPLGLSARDEAILRSVKKRAHYLDKGFSICGIRFGWTFLIGLIPVAGDVADALINYILVVRKARKADLPDWLVARMLFNNAVSAGVGFVPVVGDVILAVYKANSRNAALLDEFLRIRGAEFLKLREAEERGENPVGTTTADIEQVKPGTGMTPSERYTSSKDAAAGRSIASSAGVPPKPAQVKSGLFGMRKEQSAAASESDPKGRFVENV
jgi:hypothetical protein